MLYNIDEEPQFVKLVAVAESMVELEWMRGRILMHGVFASERRERLTQHGSSKNCCHIYRSNGCWKNEDYPKRHTIKYHYQHIKY